MSLLLSLSIQYALGSKSIELSRASNTALQGGALHVQCSLVNTQHHHHWTDVQSQTIATAPRARTRLFGTRKYKVSASAAVAAAVRTQNDRSIMIRSLLWLLCPASTPQQFSSSHRSRIRALTPPPASVWRMAASMVSMHDAQTPCSRWHLHSNSFRIDYGTRAHKMHTQIGNPYNGRTPFVYVSRILRGFISRCTFFRQFDVNRNSLRWCTIQTQTGAGCRGPVVIYDWGCCDVGVRVAIRHRCINCGMRGDWPMFLY